MSNNNQRRIVEDAPVMRSVRVQSSTPAMAPPMPFGRGVVSMAPSKIAPTNQVGAPPPVATKAWKVSQLRPVPTFYKLERTHIKITDASVEDIASRIADCLREESVYATFNDDQVRERPCANSLEHDLITQLSP